MSIVLLIDIKILNCQKLWRTRYPLGLTVIQYTTYTSIPWPSCPLNSSATVFQTARQIEISSLLRVHIFVSVPEFLPPYFFFSRAFPEWPCCCITTATIRNSSCISPSEKTSFFTWGKARGVPDATAVPYCIIMKSETPEKFEKLLPNDYWLLVPWRFYAWRPHHTIRMILFINNTENTFYETKVLKKKHVSFLKYIYNAILISYRTFGPVSLRNLPVQHKIYRSRSFGSVPISIAAINLIDFNEHNISITMQLSSFLYY